MNHNLLARLPLVRLPFAILLLAGALLAGCKGKEQVVPPPFALTEEAMGRYCGMNLLEHAGPKGQVILTGALEPIWFSSARDTVSFTLLPEEPKEIAAIYVSDMGKAESWEQPGARNWIDARTAHYVIGSTMRGGMGAPEAVPFGSEAAARQFADESGGRVVTFDAIPAEYVLGGDTSEPAPAPAPKNGHVHG